jgi:integrase
MAFSVTFVNISVNSMSKINFVTHSGSGRKILTYTCTDGRLFYYTKQTGEVTTSPVLRRMISAIERIELDGAKSGEPITRQVIREALDRLLHKPVDNDAIEKMEAVVDQMQAGKILTPRKQKYASGSIKTFRFTISLLQRFGDGTPTMDSYKRFINWCQGLDYSINYIGSQLKNWKALAKAAGYTVPAGFKKIIEETHDIYLDEEELRAMYELDLPDRERVARDWFILDCYTGLRVSDLVRLSGKNLSGEFITISNKKTGEKVVLPVHPYARAVLKRYEGGFPPKITDVEINRTIKKVAAKAGIKGRVLFTITKGGKRKDEYLEKSQMVSCHTARRSFITNLRKNGVPDSIVMKLTGIRSAATLKRYDKLTSDEAAKIAAGLNFFR